MPQFINTNISSLTAQRNLGIEPGLAGHLHAAPVFGPAHQQRQRRRRRPGHLRTHDHRRSAACNQAARNANDGISLAQTAEGDSGQIGNNLQRMRELAVQSANATNSARTAPRWTAKSKRWRQEIDRVCTELVLQRPEAAGWLVRAQNFQVGANGTAADQHHHRLDCELSYLAWRWFLSGHTLTGQRRQQLSRHGIRLERLPVGRLPQHFAGSKSPMMLNVLASMPSTISGVAGVVATANSTISCSMALNTAWRQPALERSPSMAWFKSSPCTGVAATRPRQRSSGHSPA